MSSASPSSQRRLTFAEALQRGATDTRYDPGPFAADDGEESADVWGFTDTRFNIKPNGSVVLEGKRYMLSGLELPSLLPWVRDVFGADVGPHSTNPSQYPTEVPASRASEAELKALTAIVGEQHVTVDAEQRLRRGHGHGQAEMYAIKHGRLERVPDVVVYPEDEAQVVALVALAVEQKLCLIPFGGGTNVSEALRCPTEEQRTIVSIDVRRMNRIKWIDPVNRMACVQAGAVGRHIRAQLAEHGFTMGHEPDSIEFSTLGGWIATHASGMKKNRYGNIEDLVLDVRVVTPSGVLSRESALPRESLGSDVRRLVLGCEGAFGIVTEAVIKLFPAPEAEVFGSILFPDFQRGVQFMYALSRSGQLPASVRLVDNEQLQLNFVLKPKSSGFRATKSALEKFFVTRVKGYDPQKMVACTLVFEGRQEEVEDQQDQVYRMAKEFGGLPGGAENGQRGYMLTYGIAYIRDWVLGHWLLAESFETSVPWTKAVPLIERVKARVAKEHAARKLPGKPFITARVTQLYATGVCIYFYFAFYYKGVENPSQVYHDIEAAARDEILKAGGSLSHHHGVGKLRQPFLPEVLGDVALDWREGIRAAIDPQGIFGARNLTRSADGAAHGTERVQAAANSDGSDG